MERVGFGILDGADIPQFGNNDMANKNLISAKQTKNDEFYTQYDNYDAIEVPFNDAISSDYVMA